MERLLKKQESKTTKVGLKGKILTKRQVPLITYKVTVQGSSITLPLGEEFPLSTTKGYSVY